MTETEHEVRIRPIDELDIDEIAGIDEAIGGEYRPETWEARVMYYIRRDPEGSFVAIAGDQVVGFMLGEVRSGEFGLEEPTGWIEVLGVDPGSRGQSVGRLLANAMFERFRERGAVKVRTLVDEEMPHIAGFFVALGFEPVPLKALSLDL